MKNKLSVNVALLFAVLTFFTGNARAASGDFFFGDVQMTNWTVFDHSISVPSGFQESYIDWTMNSTSNIGILNSYKQPTISRWRIQFLNSQNGQIQPIYTDQYGCPWGEIFTVRHGTAGYIYNLQRYFSAVRFVDSNDDPVIWQALYFQATGTSGNLQLKYRCPVITESGSTWYVVPAFMSSTAWKLYGRISSSGPTFTIDTAGMQGEPWVWQITMEQLPISTTDTKDSIAEQSTSVAEDTAVSAIFEKLPNETKNKKSFQPQPLENTDGVAPTDNDETNSANDS